MSVVCGRGWWEDEEIVGEWWRRVGLGGEVWGREGG